MLNIINGRCSNSPVWNTDTIRTLPLYKLHISDIDQLMVDHYNDKKHINIFIEYLI